MTNYNDIKLGSLYFIDHSLHYYHKHNIIRNVRKLDERRYGITIIMPIAMRDRDGEYILFYSIAVSKGGWKRWNNFKLHTISIMRNNWGLCEIIKVKNYYFNNSEFIRLIKIGINLIKDTKKNSKKSGYVTEAIYKKKSENLRK